MCVKAVLLVLLIGCSIGYASTGKEIRIGGGGAAIHGFIEPVKETFEVESGITLIVHPSKSGKGLVDLEQGRADVIVSAHALEHLIKGAAEDNIVVDPASLHQVEMGKNYTVVFLHKSNKIKELSKKQLNDIFTGKITNWKQLGGANERIAVVWSPSTPGQNVIFVNDILDGKPVSAKFLSAGGYEDVRTMVAATPGAIGIGPHGFISPVVRVPKSPVLASSVIMITKGAPSAEIKRLLELLKTVEFIP
jgi:phosphate transport system substrate-binding protein